MKSLTKSFVFLLAAALTLLSLYSSDERKSLTRVVSLTPNTTEIILLLGGRESLAGRSSACGYLSETKNIPIAGALGVPNMEIILSIKPDAVITSLIMNPSDAAVIENLGIKFYLLPIENFQDYYVSVNKIGFILGKEAEAENEVNRVKTNLNKLIARNKSIPDKDKPKVFWEVWNNPIITIGKNSFLNDFIQLAGGVNITSGINRNYFEISTESILTSDPDVIIAPGLPDNYNEQLKSLLGWNSVNAVMNNRVYTDLDPNLVTVFGPRMFEAISLISDFIHRKSNQ